MPQRNLLHLNTTYELQAELTKSSRIRAAEQDLDVGAKKKKLLKKLKGKEKDIFCMGEQQMLHAKKVKNITQIGNKVMTNYAK